MKSIPATSQESYMHDLSLIVCLFVCLLVVFVIIVCSMHGGI